MNHQIGFIGLGKMGKNMVLRLLEQGVDVVVYNRTREVTEEFESEYRATSIGYRETSDYKSDTRSSSLETQNSCQLFPAYDLQDLIKQLSPPRIIWLMVPSSANPPAGEAGATAGKPNASPIDQDLQQLTSFCIQKRDVV